MNVKTLSDGAGKAVQRLKAHAALTEDLTSVSSIHN